MEQADFDAVVAEAAKAGRPDIYRNIHRGLRLCMNRTLESIGRMDPSDDLNVAATIGSAREMLELFALHLEDENAFVHPALSACRPGSADRTASDHVGHLRAIADLRDRVTSLELAPRSQRAAAADQLYRRMALFVAENLEHMHFEETHNMAVLWSGCNDEAIMAIEHAIVAAIPPAMMMKFLRWMLPGMPHPDRVGLLAAMRDTAPAEVFEAVRTLAQAHLQARDWRKLAAALDLAEQAA